MLHRLPLTLVLALNLALAACGEIPSEPSEPLDQFSTAHSVAATSNSWTPIAPMPGLFQSFTSMGVVTNSAGQSTAYVFGGTTEAGGTGAQTRAYNVATNTWSTKGSQVPTFKLNGVGNIGGKLYFTGGYPEHGSPASVATTWQYDPASDKLTQRADMPLHTADGVTGVIGDKLYVLPGTCYAIGVVSPGFCVDQEANRRLFRYNPATNTWVVKRWAPHYHRNAAAGVINNKFYVVGGLDSKLGPTVNLDVYDPATNTWQTKAPLPRVLTSLAGAALQGQLFVVGRTSTQTIKHYAYNPTSNTWTSKVAPTQFIGPAAAVLLNGKSRILVVGGGIYTP
jgi:N-acetylneuraminic acid mutarotase